MVNTEIESDGLDPSADKQVTFNSSGYTVGADGYVVSLGSFPYLSLY
jgi:hypothetical protein